MHCQFVLRFLYSEKADWFVGFAFSQSLTLKAPPELSK